MPPTCGASRIHSADAMVDWYWKLCVQVQPAVALVSASCQVCTELGEHAAVHCSEAVMMSPGLTGFEMPTAPAG